MYSRLESSKTAKSRRWHSNFIKRLHRRFRYVQMAPTELSALGPLLDSLHPIQTQYPLRRLGPQGDGGYLLPDDLDGVTACFSPGVGSVSGFESACANLNMRVLMADASVNLSGNERFEFTRKHIGLCDSDETITMDSWILNSRLSEAEELLLQMDIEGAEWIALASISAANLRRFRIIILELHDFDTLLDQKFFEFRAPILARILEDFFCVHLHPNNCCGSRRRDGIELPRIIEMTLIRKDRARFNGYCSTFPNTLDVDNTDNPTMRLPKYLFRNSPL
jgi:hypothetical protein